MQNKDILKELDAIRSELSQLRGQIGMISLMMVSGMVSPENLERDFMGETASAIGFSDPGEREDDGE